MADTDTTGATKELSVDTEKLAATDSKKKTIKMILIVVIIAALGFVVWKYVLKK
jgi:hypothetical protein